MVTDDSTINFDGICTNKELTCSKVSFDVCYEKKRRSDLRCLADPICHQEASRLYIKDVYSAIDDQEGKMITQFFNNTLQEVITKTQYCYDIFYGDASLKYTEID